MVLDPWLSSSACVHAVSALARSHSLRPAGSVIDAPPGPPLDNRLHFRLHQKYPPPSPHPPTVAAIMVPTVLPLPAPRMPRPPPALRRTTSPTRATPRLSDLFVILISRYRGEPHHPHAPDDPQIIAYMRQAPRAAPLLRAQLRGLASSSRCATIARGPALHPYRYGRAIGQHTRGPLRHSPKSLLRLPTSYEAHDRHCTHPQRSPEHARSAPSRSPRRSAFATGPRKAPFPRPRDQTAPPCPQPHGVPTGQSKHALPITNPPAIAQKTIVLGPAKIATDPTVNDPPCPAPRNHPRPPHHKLPANPDGALRDYTSPPLRTASNMPLTRPGPGNPDGDSSKYPLCHLVCHRATPGAPPPSERTRRTGSQ
jgi:hypothetical protein